MSKKKRRNMPGTLEWAAKVPRGEQFVMHPWAMRASPAWQNMPLREWKLIQFFEHQHLAKKGRENGNLLGPYRQVGLGGIHKNYISRTFAGLIKRKLLVRTRDGSFRSNTRGEAATYRLTYLPARKADGTYEPPTHDWRHYPDNDTATKEVERAEPPRRAASGT